MLKLRIVSVSCGVVQTQSYDKLNRLKTIKTNNLLTHYSYLKHGDHATNFVCNEQFSVGNKTTGNIGYAYDDKGNILEVRENNHLVARYEYDGLSRLVREDNKKLNKTTTFAYDAGGNIVCKTEFDFSLANNLNFETGTSFDYFYAAEGWRDQLVSFAGEEFEYDSIGNPTKYRNHNLQWEMGRQLKRFGENEYEYNASGIRTSKTINGTKTKFYLNGTQILRQEDDENKIDFLYGTNGILGFNLDGVNYLYKKNNQGDILGIVNENGIEIGKYVYDAWGKHKCLILTNNGEYAKYGEKTIYTNEEKEYNKVINLNPIRYRGYYYDTETKLYYLNSRYYDPEIGRFINADDLSCVNKNEINGLNLYAYCVNNPINNIDKNGYNWFKNAWNKVKNFFSETWDIIVGAVVSAVLIGVGTTLTIFSGGALANLGSTMIGAGVGGFLGGLQNKFEGGSYWGGYLGGALAGGLTAGLGTTFGPIGAFVGGFIGNIAGTVVTDAIDGVKIIGKDYWSILFADSLLSGTIAVGANFFGDSIRVLKVPGLKDIFATLNVWAEFVFSYLFEAGKSFFRNVAELLGSRLKLYLK